MSDSLRRVNAIANKAELKCALRETVKAFEKTASATNWIKLEQAMLAYQEAWQEVFGLR